LWEQSADETRRRTRRNKLGFGILLRREIHPINRGLRHQKKEVVFSNKNDDQIKRNPKQSHLSTDTKKPTQIANRERKLERGCVSSD
jgi:hypothetical protein